MHQYKKEGFLSQFKKRVAQCKKQGINGLYYFINVYEGITLIEVPYWWDKSISSLVATIYHYRPDLFKVKPGDVDRIPQNPPKN